MRWFVGWLAQVAQNRSLGAVWNSPLRVLTRASTVLTLLPISTLVSGYDGGDCCECTCVNTTENSCGVGTSFACVDPSASSSCVVDHGGSYDDDTIILLPASDDLTRQTPAPTATTTPTGENLGATPEANSTASLSCVSDSLSDGSCDADNNNEECGASRLVPVYCMIR